MAFGKLQRISECPFRKTNTNQCTYERGHKCLGKLNKCPFNKHFERCKLLQNSKYFKLNNNGGTKDELRQLE